VTAALLGQQTPRLQLAPPSVSNAAGDAIDMYKACGRRLDEWQQLSLRIGCGETRAVDASWASFENGIIVQRQNGKGAVIEALMLASAFVWGNAVTVYSAHHGDTVEKTWRAFKALVEGTPELLRRCKPINDSDYQVELIGGALILFKIRTRAGGRGLTGDLVILDEALEVNPEQLATLVPILLAIPHAQLWYFSTVPQDADQHLCSVRARVLDGSSPRLAWAEWGVDKEFALERGYDSPEVLAEANPALNIRITLERLADLRKILGDEKFATECLGIWPTMSVGAVLDPAAWAKMADKESRRAGDVVLVLDMTPLRDHGSIGLYGLRSDGLEHMQLVDYRAGVDWMVPRAAELDEALDPLAWAVDGKNGAHALLPELLEVGIAPPENPEEPQRGDLFVLDAKDAADAVGRFIDGFRGRLVEGVRRMTYRHIGQEPLDDAVRNAKARPIGDAGQIAWGRRVSAVDIGPLKVVTDGKYVYETWHDLVISDYDPLGSVQRVEGQCEHCDAWAPPGLVVTHYDDCPTLQPDWRTPAHA
jgi:hypothetical protein